MVQASQRAIVRGPTFIRLLARLTDADVPPSRQSLSDRLSHWLDWTHAIALSTALDSKPSPPGPEAPATYGAEENESARIRTSLTNAIVGECELAISNLRGAQQATAEPTGASAPIDYTAFRKRYIAMQRAMQTATGNLRGRLRDIVAEKSTDMARLAEVDAVMELALSPREQSLLAAVPTLLGEHFERLRQTEQQAQADNDVSESAPTTAPAAWPDLFCKDMQSVLLAELDVRFQPVEGLLAALRTS